MEYENNAPDVHVPLSVELAPGTYSWCSCGRTSNVPWCDGSHCEGEGPVTFELTAPGTHAICNCGKTNTPPYCDNTHATAED